MKKTADSTNGVHFIVEGGQDVEDYEEELLMQIVQKNALRRREETTCGGLFKRGTISSVAVCCGDALVASF